MKSDNEKVKINFDTVIWSGVRSPDGMHKSFVVGPESPLSPYYREKKKEKPSPLRFC